MRMEGGNRGWEEGSQFPYFPLWRAPPVCIILGRGETKGCGGGGTVRVEGGEGEGGGVPQEISEGGSDEEGAADWVQPTRRV